MMIHVIFATFYRPSKKYTSTDDIELVVPKSLQMDWCNIPPFFCSGSETARDIISNILPKNLSPYKFEDIMMKECTSTCWNYTSMTLLE